MCGALDRRIVDLRLETLERLGRRQPGVVVADLDRGDRRDQHQLRLPTSVQLVGARHELLDPAAALRHPVPCLPEQPEDPKEVRQGRDVVIEGPSDRGRDVALVPPQSVGPGGLVFGRPRGLLHEIRKKFACRRSMSAWSSRSARRSAASSRTEVTIRNRGSLPVGSTVTRLCPASVSIRSSVRSSVRPETCTAAASVQPSTKTDRVAIMPSSSISRSPKLHSTVARRVRWRSGRSAGPTPSASRLVRSRSSSAVGSRRRVRAAASSIASGSPSSRRQISVDSRSVLLGQGEAISGGLGAVDEEPHRGQRCHVLDLRSIHERRHGKGTDRILPLGTDPQHRPTGREDAETRAASEEPVELGCDADDMLELVEDEEGRCIRHVFGHRVQRRPRALDVGAERRCDAWHHELRSRDRSERQVPGSLWVAVVEPTRHGDREPGLADPARTDEGHEPAVWRLDQAHDLVDLLVAPDERGRGHRDGALAPEALSSAQWEEDWPSRRPRPPRRRIARSARARDPRARAARAHAGT